MVMPLLCLNGTKTLPPVDVRIKTPRICGLLEASVESKVAVKPIFGHAVTAGRFAQIISMAGVP